MSQGGRVSKSAGYRVDRGDMSGSGRHNFSAQFSQGDPANRRQSWREPVVASGVLTSPGASGAAGQRAVRVINVSAGGVGLISPAPLSVGAELMLAIPGRPDRSGMVRVVFCRKYQHDYEVGVQFLAPQDGD